MFLPTPVNQPGLAQPGRAGGQAVQARCAGGRQGSTGEVHQPGLVSKGEHPHQHPESGRVEPWGVLVKLGQVHEFPSAEQVTL